MYLGSISSCSSNSIIYRIQNLVDDAALWGRKYLIWMGQWTEWKGAYQIPLQESLIEENSLLPSLFYDQYIQSIPEYQLLRIQNTIPSPELTSLQHTILLLPQRYVRRLLYTQRKFISAIHHDFNNDRELWEKRKHIPTTSIPCQLVKFCPTTLF